MTVNIRTQPALTFSDTVTLSIPGMVAGPAGARNYDITPDGKRFIVVLNANQAQSENRTTQQIQIVTNWFEELKQRIPLRIR